MAGAGRRHLDETGLRYQAHRRRAWRIGSAMTLGGLACMVHGLFPALFRETASRTILRLNKEISAGPAHHAPPALLEFEI
jgi:Family of unknown function (DUF6356)